MLPPVLPTPAIEKTDELLKVKGADGWGIINRGVGGWGLLTIGPILNGSVVNCRVNDTFAFIFCFGW